jgi:hypothetical protein
VKKCNLDSLKIVVKQANKADITGFTFQRLIAWTVSPLLVLKYFRFLACAEKKLAHSPGAHFEGNLEFSARHVNLLDEQISYKKAF